MDIFINIFSQCIIIFVVTVCFSIFFNVKSSELVFCGITGTIAFGIYKISLDIYGLEIFGVVFGTFLSTCLSRKLAFYRKMPVTLYVIPSIIPLAPGGSIYLTMYSIIYGEYIEALRNGYTTIKIAGCLVLGMSIALSLPYTWFNRRIKIKN